MLELWNGNMIRIDQGCGFPTSPPPSSPPVTGGGVAVPTHKIFITVMHVQIYWAQVTSVPLNQQILARVAVGGMAGDWNC